QLGHGFAEHELHDDVPRAVDLAVVIGLGDPGVGQARGVARLGAEALEEAGVARELLAQHLDRDVPGERDVVRDPHLAHAAHGDLRLEAVAPVEGDPDVRLHPSITACSTARAIGAATRPPVASEPSDPPRSTTTATATWGSSAGAKAVNHACGSSPSACCAVPVLPATSTPPICAAVPEPERTTSTIISVSACAVAGDTERRSSVGLASSTTARSAVRTRSTR